MPRTDPPAFPDLATLHRLYDGPPPRDAVRAAQWGGSARAAAARRDAAISVNERLAADARLAIARRRAALPLRSCPSDGWLARLCAALAHHRAVALRLRQTV